MALCWVSFPRMGVKHKDAFPASMVTALANYLFHHPVSALAPLVRVGTTIIPKAV
jgi:hypothetical protein